MAGVDKVSGRGVTPGGGAHSGLWSFKPHARTIVCLTVVRPCLFKRYVSLARIFDKETFRTNNCVVFFSTLYAMYIFVSKDAVDKLVVRLFAVIHILQNRTTSYQITKYKTKSEQEYLDKCA